MAELRLDGVCVAIDRSAVLERLDAVVPDGAFAAVVGPSGSGKSTLLRVIAGLERATAGSVSFDGLDITNAHPRDRDIGMVFQAPALFNHRSVRRNVSFPLELRRESAESIGQRVDAESRAMHIDHLLARSPRYLSRGEQQLVQIARTMVRTPQVLLLDEPFAPLDEHLRRRMRAEIKMLQEGYGITTLMATNDPDDVAAVASHVVVLDRPGAARSGPHTIVQSGTPTAIERDPVSLSVATAAGALWMLQADVSSDVDGFWLRSRDDRGLRLRAWSPALAGWNGEQVVVGFRAGDLVAHEAGEMHAVLDRIVPGAIEPLMCRVGESIVYASVGEHHVGDFRRGQPLRLRVDGHLVFDPVTGNRIA